MEELVCYYFITSTNLLYDQLKGATDEGNHLRTNFPDLRKAFKLQLSERWIVYNLDDAILQTCYLHGIYDYFPNEA